MLKRIIFLTILSLSLCTNLTSEPQSPSHLASKKSSPLTDFIFGFVLFIIAFPMIWYNQRKLAIDSKHLAESKQICESYSPNESFPPGRLIHLTGHSVTNEVLQERRTGVSVKNALKLTLKVEVKEWRKAGGKSAAVLEWVDENKEEVDDYHSNSPAHWVMHGETIYARNAHLGRYLLTESQLEKCRNEEVVPLSELNVGSLRGQVGGLANKQARVINEYIYWSNSGDFEDAGSMRVKVTYCPVGPISVICSLSPSSHLIPYPLVNDENQHPCYLTNIVNKCLSPMSDLDLVSQNLYDKDTHFAEAISISTHMAIILRIVGFLCILFGILLILSPISRLLGYIPFVGAFVRLGANFLFFIGAFLVTIPMFLITVSLAWLYYRPRVGVVILGVGLLLLALLIGYNYMMGGNQVVVPVGSYVGGYPGGAGFLGPVVHPKVYY